MPRVPRFMPPPPFFLCAPGACQGVGPLLPGRFLDLAEVILLTGTQGSRAPRPAIYAPYRPCQQHKPTALARLQGGARWGNPTGCYDGRPFGPARKRYWQALRARQKTILAGASRPPGRFSSMILAGPSGPPGGLKKNCWRSLRSRQIFLIFGKSILRLYLSHVHAH